MKHPTRLGDLDHLTRPGEGVSDEGLLRRFANTFEVSDLGWPDDVVEQFLFEHGKNSLFVAQYGQLDLTTIAWEAEDLSLDVLLQVTRYGPLDGVPEAQAEADQILRRYSECQIETGWERLGTWARSPVLIEQALLTDGQIGLHLVEGHTRLGVLRGLVKRGAVSVNSTHRTWVGRRKSTPLSQS